MFEVKENLAKTALFSQDVHLKVGKSGDLLFVGGHIRGRRTLRVLLDVIHFEDGFAYKHNCYLTVGPVKWLFQWGDAKGKGFDEAMLKDLADKGIHPDSDGAFPPLRVELREIWD